MTPSTLVQLTVRAMDLLDLHRAELDRQSVELDDRLRRIQQCCYHIYETIVPDDATIESYERCGLCRQVFVKDRP